MTFGEAMLLLVADRPGPIEQAESFHKRTAGAETNVAIGLARLGLKVGWASRLGTDSMGRYLLAEMQREGIDCSHVRCDAGARTGFQFKGRVTDGSDPPVEYHRKGSAASQMGVEDVDEAWLRSARHLHATGVFAAISDTSLQAACKTLQVMRDAGRTISFDPNLRPTLWASPELMRHWINHLAAQADWVLPGLDEGRFLTGEQTPEAIAGYYRRARRPDGGSEARARGRLFRQRNRLRLRPGLSGRPGDRHRGRRRWLRGRRDQRAAGGPQRRAGGAPRRLDRRPRGAGAGRH